MINILICDDHQLMIDGIKLMLSEEIDLKCIGQALNGQEALDFIKENHVDVLILDINMPVLNGLETCKIVAKKYPHVKVVGLSMLNDIELVQKIIKNGAMGYLLKNSGQDEILQTIRDVYQGKTSFDPKLLNQLILLQSKQVQKVKTSLFPKLSRREKEILSLIIEENTTSEISEMLHISFGTVETHRRNIIIKLGVRNMAGMVRVALEYNLLEQ